METLTEIFGTLPSEYSWLILGAAIALLCVMMYFKEVSPAPTPPHLGFLMWLMIIASLIFRVIINAERRGADVLIDSTGFSFFFIVLNLFLLVYFVIYNNRDPYAPRRSINVILMALMHGLTALVFAASMGFAGASPDINVKGAGVVITLLLASITVTTVRLQGRLEDFDRHLSRGEE
ncbi:MAG: hypothetical protein Q8Q67_01705 [bacterium]|nr:hypothetical protein [bacterium]